MRRLITLLVSAVLCLALAAPAAAGEAARPFRGWTAGTDSYGPPTGCPAGAAWRYTSTGVGELTHLGWVTFVITHCSWFTGPTTGAFGPGTMTLTAANGDTLVLSEWGTFAVAPTPDGLLSTVTLHWTVASGTGRFAGASGAGDGWPIGRTWLNETTATLDGWLTY